MTAILDEILDSLLDDAPVRQICRGPRATAVWSRRLGLAFCPPCEAPGALVPQRTRGTARELAQSARSSDVHEASLGIAAINSLLEVETAYLRPGNAYSLILAQGAGKDVTLVGHFAFVEQLRPLVRNLWVLELSPQQGDLPAREAPRVIPRSDLVVITGSTLVNHTLDDLLQLAAGRYVLLLGATTILSPVLFDHGVAAIGGIVTRNVDDALQAVAKGQSFRQTHGIEKVIWAKSSSKA